MIFKSKADTIQNLQKKKIKFLIPKTYVFEINNWIKNREKILLDIKKKFKKKIIIRSSSYDEDNYNLSQAGKYLSILNINPSNKILIKNSITKVIKSYKNTNLLNKIIIQNQILNVSMSGVIFTHDLSNGSPYYVVNYDDQSKKTTTVTSGVGTDSNKKLIIYRDGIKSLKSPRFKKLLKSVVDLEKVLNNKYLDIEYAVDKKLNLFLLQVRSITTVKKWPSSKNFLKKNISKTKKQINLYFHKKKKYSIFGQMPDWNPAEIIGKNPKKLSISLYSKIITDKIWAISREQMGYKKLKKKKINEYFCWKTIH